MYRRVEIAKFIREVSALTRPSPPAALSYSTQGKVTATRPPQVGKRPLQPPNGELKMGGPPNTPKTNMLDLTCQPCEFPPPTTSTPYRTPVAVNFAARKTSVSRRDEKLESALLAKDKIFREKSDKVSKDLDAKLQISTRSIRKVNNSTLANCFKSNVPGRNSNINK